MGGRRGGGWWLCWDRAAGCWPPAAWRGPSRQAQAQGPSSDFPALGGPRGAAEPPHHVQAGTQTGHRPRIALVWRSWVGPGPAL